MLDSGTLKGFFPPHIFILPRLKKLQSHLMESDRLLKITHANSYYKWGIPPDPAAAGTAMKLNPSTHPGSSICTGFEFFSSIQGRFATICPSYLNRWLCTPYANVRLLSDFRLLWDLFKREMFSC